MKAKELIDQYNQTVEAEKRTKQQKETEEIQSAQERFVENCKIWLGDLWDEFQPGEVEKWKANYDIHFSLPVSFMGVPGEVESVFQTGAHRGNGWHSLKIDFGQLRFPDGSGPWVNQTLYMSDGVATPVHSYQMGELLSWIAKHAPHRAENERLRLEQEREDALEFHGNQAQTREQVEKRVQEFPDLESRIREAGRVHIEALALKELKRQQEAAHYEAMDLERAHLRELANYAWKSPFTIYLISYGAYLAGEEEGAYVREIYTLEEDPDSDGYYLAYDQGKRSRKIRPTHVLSTEEITIRDCQSAPHEIKQWIQLTSKKHPEAKAMVYLPPREIFTFDMEEVELALAEE